MKYIIMGILSVAFLNFAQAEKLTPMEQEIESYIEETKNDNMAKLTVKFVAQMGKMIGICGGAVAAVELSYLSDAAPAWLNHILAEPMAKSLSDSYAKRNEPTGTWHNFKEAFGLLLTLPTDLGDYVINWLANDQDTNWENLSEQFSSSIATQERLFADDSKCKLSAAKLSALIYQMGTYEAPQSMR